MQNMNLSFSFIGAGNVATHLAQALKNKGHKIVQIYSRTTSSAKTLANKVDAAFTKDIDQISDQADVYIVALKDSVFNEVLSQLDLSNKLLVHCSGSLPLNVLMPYSRNIGVLYPLQTFSKNRELDFQKVPVFVEANNKKDLEILCALANTISNNVSRMDSEKRKSLHVAAVMACNFSNHFYAMAAEYLNSKEIAFDVLRPLIEETAQKVQELMPKDAQTGPAIRFDTNIIDKHLEALSEFPSYQNLYNSISQSIFEYHKEKQ